MMFPKCGKGMTDFYIEGDFTLWHLKTYISYYKSSYFKHQEQGNICYSFTKEKGNLDSEIAKVENLKSQKFSALQLCLVQFLDNLFLKTIRSFSPKDKTPLASCG